MDEVNETKMGRPVTKDFRRVNVSLGADVIDLLAKKMAETGKNRTLLIEEAVNMCYNTD